MSVTGVLGGGGGRGWWSSGWPVSICDGVGPPRFPHRPGVQTRTWSPQSIAVVRREGMTVESHPSPTAPKADIKTFPSPPTTEKTGGYIEERVFGVFGPTSVILGPTLFRRPPKADIKTFPFPPPLPKEPAVI
jgi:hypothetical protein